MRVGYGKGIIFNFTLSRVPTDNQTYSLTVDSPTNGRATPHKRAFARFKADQYSKIVEVTLAR